MTRPSLVTCLDEAIVEGVAPGLQACIFSEGKPVHASAHGVAFPGGPAITASTRFDLASLTKVLATTSAAAVLLGRGALRLDEPVTRLVPELRATRGEITLRHLLAHTSGLPAWAPLFAAAIEDDEAKAIFPGPAPRASEAFSRSRTLVLRRLFEVAPQFTAGERRIYSDLGFLVLGELLARAAGAPFASLCADEVFAPLGLPAIAFHPPQDGAPEGAFAATGLTRPRAPAPGQEGAYPYAPTPTSLRVGEVDDDNAYALDGVASHAGLFGTASDVAAFGARLLEELAGAERLAPAAIWRALASPDEGPSGPPRALGFDLPSEGGALGRLLGKGSQGAIGHLGFTGCSLFLDLDRELSLALLSNRVYPSRANVEGIRRLRPAFHDAAAREISG